MPDRRRGQRTVQQRLANEKFEIARRAARERGASRRTTQAAERQQRALARLAKEQEREEALASAADEHEENERFLSEIREILKLAPVRLRTRADHEALRARRPFPPPEREAADRERLAHAMREALARVHLGGMARLGVLLPWVGLAVLLCGAGVWAAIGGLGAWASVLIGLGALVGAASGFLARGRAAAREQALRSREEERVRQATGVQLAADLERDRVRHEQAEDERLAALERLLAGDAETCAAAFAHALDAIELPLSASAALEMTGTDEAEVEIDLHQEIEIPVQRSTLLKTGRISYRNRPKKEVREDDARTVAALCFLYAGIALDALPALAQAVVSAFRTALDPATGKDAELCFASAVIDREGFAALKLDRIDPIAALLSFPGRFSCTAGFVLKPVEPMNGDASASAPREKDRAAEPPRAAVAPAPELAAPAPLDSRAACLEALEIPPVARVDRATIERARARLMDLYAPERFEQLAPDVQETARRRRERIAEATSALLRELPVPPAPPSSAERPPAPGEVRRDNPDLDSIFG